MRFSLFIKAEVVILMTCATLEVSAQKVITVENEYTFCAPPNMTPMEAKAEAIKRAQTEAIANKFGIIVTSNHFIGMDNINGQSHTSFVALGESEVKGEWLRDIEEPKISNITPMEDMTFCITVHVKGEVREIVSYSVNNEVRLLKNGMEDSCESDDFKSGDRFYMSFRSPINGYLAIYMLDDYGQAWRLLPYAGTDEPSYKIIHDKRYVFFAGLQNDGGIIMTCDQQLEFNHIYTIFSPNKFTRSLDIDVSQNDDGAILPPKLTLKDFQKWFVGIRKRDKELTVNRNTLKVVKHE